MLGALSVWVAKQVRKIGTVPLVCNADQLPADLPNHPA
jgi:hypothetical protein